MSPINRRQFLRHRLPLLALAGSAALTMAACTPNEIEKSAAIQWRMRTSWQKDMAGLFEAAQRLAKRINHSCAGRLKVSVQAAESSEKAFGVFDEVAAERCEMAHTSAQFWAGKSLATTFFSSLPFGMTAGQSTSWLLAGEGWALWPELYAKFGLTPFPVGNTNAQIAGWFTQELKSLRGVKGLKLRVTALMTARNQQALLTLVGVHKINVVRLPTDVITALSRSSEAVRSDLAARDQFARRVFDSAMAFREQARQWQQVGDQAFVTARG